MRGFSGTDLVQSNGGSNTLASSINMTVPSSSVEGNAGIVAAAIQLPFAPPAGWHIAAVPSTGLLAIMCRADLPGGESSWPFSTSSGASANWAWSVGEWANVASCPIETTAATTGTGAASSVSTGATGSFSTRFVVGMAAFAITSAGGSTWPTVSYDSGFVETDSRSVGTGAANGDILLKTAVRYGVDSETGPWNCTATFTGSMASKTPMAVMVVFRAEDLIDCPLVISS